MKRARQSPAGDAPQPGQRSEAALSDADVDRYARQVIIPGVGARGQARLLASTLCVLGEDEASALARRYARAAGLRIDSRPGSADCVIVGDAGETERGGDTSRPDSFDATRTGVPIVWYRVDGDELSVGVAHHPAELPTPRAGVHRDAAQARTDRARRAVAACDAVATAIALLLGWPGADAPHGVRLA